MKKKILLVTLAIGQKYLDQYNYSFRESQENYAKRYGYDFRVVTDFLDKDPANHMASTITLNKILVCSQEWSKEYDMIIFVDADILISVSSPPIHKYMDYGDCIGIADDHWQPSRERSLEMSRERPDIKLATPADCFKSCDLGNIETDYAFNTGVLVMQPKKHAEFLEKVYKKYIQNQKTHKKGYLYENYAIGYELLKNNLYKVLPNKFNAVWALTLWDNIHGVKLEDYYRENWFIHFAGKAELNKVHSLHNNYNKLFG